MTATDTEAMSALHELLDERQRYQGWLETLDSRRSSTPPHVYERVQRDYSGRLDRVMQTLAERAGQLTGTIASMTADLASLRQKEADRTDERHEAELRAVVGEFSPDDWERRRAEVDGDLEQMAAERHSIESELEELQRIVALTRSVKPQASGDVIPQDDDAVSSPAVEARDAGQTGQSIDDFMAEWHPPHDHTVTTPATVTGGDDSIVDTADLGDEIIPASPMGGNPVGAAGADYGIANGVTGATGFTPSAPQRTPPPAPVADARRGDTDKTLKCPECGAMNYATEWYCERCGGELSTF
jgi:predicted  nucleic acid-binding Zn-ribbon protein